jgi:hypothetical protein
MIDEQVEKFPVEKINRNKKTNMRNGQNKLR